MESLKDGAESVKDEMLKRMRSPFVGAFVIAWCVVNYEELIVVFSNGDYADRYFFVVRRLIFGFDLPEHSCVVHTWFRSGPEVDKGVGGIPKPSSVIAATR